MPATAVPMNSLPSPLEAGWKQECFTEQLGCCPHISRSLSPRKRRTEGLLLYTVKAEPSRKGLGVSLSRPGCQTRGCHPNHRQVAAVRHMPLNRFTVCCVLSLFFVSLKNLIVLPSLLSHLESRQRHPIYRLCLPKLLPS